MSWPGCCTTPAYVVTATVIVSLLLQLFDALKSNSSITSVNLSANHIGDDGVQVCAWQQLCNQLPHYNKQCALHSACHSSCPMHSNRAQVA
jgi:hypothetical protein